MKKGKQKKKSFSFLYYVIIYINIIGIGQHDIPLI